MLTLLHVMMFIAVAFATREHWVRLAGDEPATDRFLLRWALRGLALPIATWAFVNLGLLRSIPALVPDIALAQSEDEAWFQMWLHWTIYGSVFIFITWGAINYAWMALIVGRRAGSVPEGRLTMLLVGVPMFLLALTMALGGGWEWFPASLITFCFPIVQMAVNQAEKPVPIPSYALAEGKMKFGRYEDAEVEVIAQLERKENDFQGWLLLAELYATKYQRLEDAAQVVVDLCNDPTIKEIEISVACHKLADWQLQIGSNPQAARAAMDLIIQRLPGSHSAHMAELRLKQIPRTHEDLMDRKKPRPIRLPALREKDERPAVRIASDPAAKRAATEEANRMTARLEDNPNDCEARERLAIILAERLGQVNLGLEQLQLLVNMPGAEPESAAKWLGQMADWERRYHKNETKFRALLAQIIRDYPTTSFALAAQRQLNLIEQENFEKANATIEKQTTVSLRLLDPKS